jgi:hypothetical protein
VWYLFKGEIETARDYYRKILAEDNRATKLFSPCLYLLQLSILFPERLEFTEMYEWFEAEID